VKIVRISINYDWGKGGITGLTLTQKEHIRGYLWHR
jgi:hypothetical protein